MVIAFFQLVLARNPRQRRCHTPDVVLFQQDDKAYAGTLDRDMDLESESAMYAQFWMTGAERVPNKNIYPRLPVDQPITLAPKRLDKKLLHVKRSAVLNHVPVGQVEPGFQDKGQMLSEALVMETLSKRAPHPTIVRYLGCRVFRWRITAIDPGTSQLHAGGLCLPNASQVCPAGQGGLPGRRRVGRQVSPYVPSPKTCIYLCTSNRDCNMSPDSLGFAHNNINEYNVMVHEADDGSCTAVLIDLCSCGPFGDSVMRASRSGNQATATSSSRTSGMTSLRLGVSASGGMCRLNGEPRRRKLSRVH